MPTGVAAPTALSHIRFSTFSQHVISATTSMRDIIASESFDSGFRELSPETIDGQASLAYQGQEPKNKGGGGN